jgi:hypothetical protein
VLTLASREKVYGSAITFYEEYDEKLARLHIGRCCWKYGRLRFFYFSSFSQWLNLIDHINGTHSKVG